jgi:hypothetical protein
MYRILIFFLLLQFPLALQAAVWLSAEELQALPQEGPAWATLVQHARGPIQPMLADQDDPSNVNTLALALYAARTGDPSAAADVRAVLAKVPGTERGARSLAIGRELAAYVIAADLVGLPEAQDVRFRVWLRSMLEQDFQGRTLASTHEDRPNNWGTHAGASRIAVAVYLGDQQELAKAASVFRGWLGERDAWQAFEFGELWWQPPGAFRYGLNPVGAMIDGHSVDGVIPDDQRRGGPFRWPPPRENYVYEALQGAVTQAMLLERQGYDVWSWADQGLLRAFRWLHEEADYPAEGDDTWMPHVINAAYGTDFPAAVPSRPGKGMGFTDWTHGIRNRQLPKPPDVRR